MAEALVTYEARDGVGWITLNRPNVLNALSTELAAALADHAATAATDASVAQVVVRGAGRAFCSGMDRTALAAGSIGEAFYRHWNRALDGLEDMPKLTVAVLHGYSIGGGLQLALACDLRLVTDDAILGLGATRHGLVPDGAVLRLARVVGVGRAKELALLNDHVSPAEARAIGLVNWVCPHADLDRALATIIGKARGASPTATAHTKRLLHESFHRDPRGLLEDVLRAQRECVASWEMDESNRAWKERREARFYPPAGSRALVPDLGRVPPPLGPGERARRAPAQARRLVRLLAVGASARRPERPRDRADRGGGPRRVRAHARRGAAVRPQARPGDRDDAGARTGDDAARRADRRDGPRRRGAHLGADQARGGEPHGPDGRAQPQRGRESLGHHHRPGAGRSPRGGRLPERVGEPGRDPGLHGLGPWLSRCSRFATSTPGTASPTFSTVSISRSARARW